MVGVGVEVSVEKRVKRSFRSWSPVSVSALVLGVRPVGVRRRNRWCGWLVLLLLPLL